jgi:hypothetical protein
MATTCAVNSGGEKEKCSEHFGNYRTCMKFWVSFALLFKECEKFKRTMRSVFFSAERYKS